MITTKQRNEITRKAYEAIRALTGEQYKLKMISYSINTIKSVRYGLSHVHIHCDNESGEFRFKVNYTPHNYFDVKLRNGEVVSITPLIDRRAFCK